MYKIERVDIEIFWHRFDVGCEFNEDVNIIIGRNGTGKTTFMNILHAILTVDPVGLVGNDFVSAKILLKNEDKKIKTIVVRKIEDEHFNFPIIEYQISNKKYRFRLINLDDRRISLMQKRRISEESTDVRNEMFALTSVSSLSVYRLRNDDEYEVRDRHGAVFLSPVDYRLSQAMAGLTEFQLALAEEAQIVAKDLQKNVLASILYSEEDARQKALNLSFDKEAEQESLISAYEQLSSFDSTIKKKIKFHVSSIAETMSEIKSNKPEKQIDIKSLEALRKTRKIIELSLSAKDKTQLIYSQINLFLRIIHNFIPDKKFSFLSGRLVIENSLGAIEHSKLSSGEKQLIILMIEALLQKGNKHIFMADEPELSLHIAWQRQIIPAIREINPNAQIIVATHTPEVASRYKESIFDMEKLISG